MPTKKNQNPDEERREQVKELADEKVERVKAQEDDEVAKAEHLIELRHDDELLARVDAEAVTAKKPLEEEIRNQENPGAALTDETPDGFDNHPRAKKRKIYLLKPVFIDGVLRGPRHPDTSPRHPAEDVQARVANKLIEQGIAVPAEDEE